MLTLTELFMFFFRSMDYCLVVRSIKSENDIFTRFLVILSTYGTSILCAWSLTKSAISKADSFQIPIIFSKTLSLVSFLSVGVPLNLRNNLLPYCSSFWISCWFCNLCFQIFKIWFWGMVLSYSSSSILLLCFFSSFVNCNSICSQSSSNRFPHISSIFLSRLQNCSSI